MHLSIYGEVILGHHFLHVNTWISSSVILRCVVCLQQCWWWLETPLAQIGNYVYFFISLLILYLFVYFEIEWDLHLSAQSTFETQKCAVADVGSDCKLLVHSFVCRAK